MNNFQHVKHFDRFENWGNPNKISPYLLLKLDLFREYVNTPVIITCGTQGTHAPKSLHYEGKAADLICPYFKSHILDLYIAAERVGFNGIGLYSGWHYEENTYYGLHLDVRTEAARWMKTPDSSYLALNYENLKLYNFI